MINFGKITGSVAKRMEFSDKLLEDVFEQLGTRIRGKKIDSLQTILDDTLPFRTKVMPLDNPKVCGYMRPVIKDGEYLGAGLALPHDDFLNQIKLGGDDLDTFMHELAHSTHYYVDNRIVANRNEINKILQKNAAKRPEVDYNKISEKIHSLYERIFYDCEINAQNAPKFVQDFQKGGDIKTNAIKGRLSTILAETKAVLNEIPDNDLKIAFLKRMRNGLKSEDYAWAQGRKFRAQADINEDVLKLIDADGMRNELIALKEINESEYIAKVNKYFDKANLIKKQEALNEAIKTNNDIGYLFDEKIKFLNDKIAQIVRRERTKIVFKKSFDKSSVESIPFPRPVKNKSIIFSEVA